MPHRAYCPYADASDRWRAQLLSAQQRVQAIEPSLRSGRVVRATGLVLEATGLKLAVGAACRIELSAAQGIWAEAEVVGFQGNSLYLMPLSDISGLPPGARVVPVEPDVQPPAEMFSTSGHCMSAFCSACTASHRSSPSPLAQNDPGHGVAAVQFG